RDRSPQRRAIRGLSLQAEARPRAEEIHQGREAGGGLVRAKGCGGAIGAHAVKGTAAPRRATCSLPPCAGEVKRGVSRFRALESSSLPASPPQGGSERAKTLAPRRLGSIVRETEFSPCLCA